MQVPGGVHTTEAVVSRLSQMMLQKFFKMNATYFCL